MRMSKLRLVKRLTNMEMFWEGVVNPELILCIIPRKRKLKMQREMKGRVSL